MHATPVAWIANVNAISDRPQIQLSMFAPSTPSVAELSIPGDRTLERLVPTVATEDAAVSHQKAIRERIERANRPSHPGQEGLAWLIIRPANSPRAVSAAM